MSSTGGASGEAAQWEPRPVPLATPETAAFWEGATEGEFRLTECQSCGLVYHYPRAQCPDCFSADTEWLAAAGTGEIYSFAATDRVGGWPEDALPVVVAYVELDEGPRVMTNVVDCDPDELAIGDRVDVRFVPTDHDDVAVPVFTPVDG